jgi:hypothetical protein
MAERVRELLRGARGRSLAQNIEQLNPLLRGWAPYFKLTSTKQALEMLDLAGSNATAIFVLIKLPLRSHSRAFFM